VSEIPEKIPEKDNLIILAIKQGIRDNLKQTELCQQMGKKKSWIGWFLNKYNLSWRILKKEIGEEEIQLKKSRIIKNSSISRIPKPVKPPRRKSPPNDKKCQNMTKTVKPISSKITDIDMNTEEFYIDPSIINDIGPDAIASDNSNDSDTHDTIQNASEITEDLYKAVLLEHVKQASNSEHGIKVQTLTELRNYLDKTEKLLSEKKELSVDKIKFEEMKVNSDNAISEAMDFMNSEEFKKTIPKKHEME
jgi:hypothetical protein